MGRRNKIGKYYVERKANGQFQKWTSIAESMKADKRRKAKNKPKGKGRGHQGDYQRKKGGSKKGGKSPYLGGKKSNII